MHGSKEMGREKLGTESVARLPEPRSAPWPCLKKLSKFRSIQSPPLETILSQCILRYRVWGAEDRVETVRALWEGDHVANVWRVAEDGDESVKACS